MKEIKDYLQFYLGCELWSNSIKSKVGQLLGVVEDEVYFKVSGVIYSYHSHNYKLLLRPLSDMTEEEILKVCKLACPVAFGDYRFSKWQVNKDANWGKYWKAYDVTNDKSDYSYIVDVIDGDIILYDKDEYDPSIMNQNYRFWYLSKHFDLFGLIEAGLALDKTKIATLTK